MNQHVSLSVGSSSLLYILCLLFDYFFLINITLGIDNDFGCNGYDTGYGTFYPTDICLAGSAASSFEDSISIATMLICDNSTLYSFHFDTSDCSGNITNVIDETGTNKYSQNIHCNNEYISETCDYVIMFSYNSDSDCSYEEASSKNNYDTIFSSAVNQCVKTSSLLGSSQYVKCSEDSYNVKIYTNNDCTGVVTYQVTVSPYDVSSESSAKLNQDVNMYCSEAGVWSECNVNGAFKMNNSQYIISLTTFVVCLIYIAV